MYFFSSLPQSSFQYAQKYGPCLHREQSDFPHLTYSSLIVTLPGRFIELVIDLIFSDSIFASDLRSSDSTLARSFSLFSCSLSILFNNLGKEIGFEKIQPSHKSFNFFTILHHYCFVVCLRSCVVLCSQFLDKTCCGFVCRMHSRQSKQVLLQHNTMSNVSNLSTFCYFLVLHIPQDQISLQNIPSWFYEK